MRSDFSKPLGDLTEELGAYLANSEAFLARQTRISKILEDRPLREACGLCRSPLGEGRTFLHRQLEFVDCATCGQIQTAVSPPPGYPTHVEDGVPFSVIYPKLSPDAFASRRDRIYRPKVEWVLGCDAALRATRGDILRRRWLEIGSGGGYFVSALRDAGARDIVGLEEDETLVEAANEALGEPLTRAFRESVAEGIRAHDADVYVALFVLEHVGDLRPVLEALRARPPGTVFFFAVPTMGLSTWLESAFDHFHARNLDGVAHTQVFTDASIRYAMDYAKYEVVAEWVFGQDAADFVRMLVTALHGKYPPSMIEDIRRAMWGVQDATQSALDRARLASERHILAVKR